MIWCWKSCTDSLFLKICTFIWSSTAKEFKEPECFCISDRVIFVCWKPCWAFVCCVLQPFLGAESLGEHPSQKVLWMEPCSSHLTLKIFTVTSACVRSSQPLCSISVLKLPWWKRRSISDLQGKEERRSSLVGGGGRSYTWILSLHLHYSKKLYWLPYLALGDGVKQTFQHRLFCLVSKQ